MAYNGNLVGLELSGYGVLRLVILMLMLTLMLILMMLMQTFSGRW